VVSKTANQAEYQSEATHIAGKSSSGVFVVCKGKTRENGRENAEMGIIK